MPSNFKIQLCELSLLQSLLFLFPPPFGLFFFFFLCPLLPALTRLCLLPRHDEWSRVKKKKKKKSGWGALKGAAANSWNMPLSHKLKNKGVTATRNAIKKPGHWATGVFVCWSLFCLEFTASNQRWKKPTPFIRLWLRGLNGFFSNDFVALTAQTSLTQGHCYSNLSPSEPSSSRWNSFLIVSSEEEEGWMEVVMWLLQPLPPERASLSRKKTSH